MEVLKLSDGKVIKIENNLYNIKKLKQQNFNFKRKIKGLKKKVKNRNDEGNDNEEREHACDQFIGKQSKKNYMKILLLGLHY